MAYYPRTGAQGRPGALDAHGDTGVPPKPTFGIFTNRDGKLLFGPLGFGTLDNTHSISSGRAFIRYADEIAGAKTTLAADIDDTTETITVASSAGFSEGDHAVLDQECIQIQTIAGTTWTVARGQFGSPAAAHSAGANIYDLAARLVTFAFPPGFFGSGPDAQWEAVIDLPCARIASIQLWVTNAFGDAPVATNNYLIYQMEPDAPYGYRTNHPDAPITLGLPGAVMAGNPGLWQSFGHARSIRDVYAWLPAGWAADNLTLNVVHKRWVAGAETVIQTIALTVPHDAPVDAVSGASLLPAAADDWVEYGITGTVPAGCADLEVVVR